MLVPAVSREGRSVSVALEERAVPHRLVGEAAFFQQAEIRDLLAWLRLLADPTRRGRRRARARPPPDRAALGRHRPLHPDRPPSQARHGRRARRRDRVPPGPARGARADSDVPEALPRLRPADRHDAPRPVRAPADRAARAAARPAVRRAGGRRRAAAGARAVRRARRGVRRPARRWRPPREFARSISAVAEHGLREQEEPELDGGRDAVQVLEPQNAGGLEVDHVYVARRPSASRARRAPEPVPDALLREQLPPDDEAGHRARAAPAAIRRAHTCAHADRAQLRHRASGPRRRRRRWSSAREARRRRLGAPSTRSCSGRPRRCSRPTGCCATSCCSAPLARVRRLGELRFDTDLDVSHAVVRYLELLKVAALLARPEGQRVADALHDVNARILQAVTAEQREIFTSSTLDDYLLGAERDARRRAQAIAARDEPSLEAFLPRRGDGVILSASDIDTYRSCPLKYKFARVFRIPQEPTLHQRFGIACTRCWSGSTPVGEGEPLGSLAELLGLLDVSWRRGGFGDSEEERQLRGKAAAALARYHERAQSPTTRDRSGSSVSSRSSSAPICFGAGSTGSTGSRRRVRADRLQDGPPEDAPSSSPTTSSCPCTRSAPARRGASRPHARPTITCSTTRRCRYPPTTGTGASGSAPWRERSPRGSCCRRLSRPRRSPPAGSATTGSSAPPPSASPRRPCVKPGCADCTVSARPPGVSRRPAGPRRAGAGTAAGPARSSHRRGRRSRHPPVRRRLARGVRRMPAHPGRSGRPR